MQDEDQKLNNLSAETVQKAIDAVKAKDWDINPFTVADELKISRSSIYRHAEIMKMIIAARGGGFGMDVQTSLDLTWQLRQLELQNDELRKKLATGALPEADILDKPIEIIPDSIIADKETDKTEEAIFNFVNDGPPVKDYFSQLAHLSWKDIETVYYSRVSSFKEYARNTFNTNEPDKANGDIMFDIFSAETPSISYGSLTSLSANKQPNQNLSPSPFARLKTVASGANVSSSPAKESQSPTQNLESNTLAEKQATEAKEIDTPPPVLKKLGTQPSSEEVEFIAALPEKQIDELEDDLFKLASQLQAGIAEKIRTSLGEMQTSSGETIITSAKTSIPANLETAKTPDEPEDWQRFAGGEKISQNVDAQAVDIKLIPMLKSASVNAELIIESAIEELDKFTQSQTDTGDIEVRWKESVAGAKESAPVTPDELRNLIESHIKNAVEQMGDSPHGHSIGSGKEFEVWLNNPARSKFVGSTKAPDTNAVEEEENKNRTKQFPFKPRVVPADVRKSCLILGLRPDNITDEVVQEAWKKAIAAPGVHPDLGGDTELAVYLNTAKDVLMRFLDAQAPKLGKKFGPFKTEKDAKTKEEKPKDE